MSTHAEPPPLDHDDAYDDAPERGTGCFKAGLIGCGALFLLVAVSLGGLGLALELGYLPAEVVQRGEDLSDRIRDRVTEVALEDGETIVWFYSTALFDAGDDGNVLTDRRVISYWVDPETDERVVESIPLGDVGFIEVEFVDDFLSDTTLWVWPRDGVEPVDGVVLYLSAETDADHLFVHDLARSARAAGAELESVLFKGATEPRDFEEVPGSEPGDLEWDGADPDGEAPDDGTTAAPEDD